MKTILKITFIVALMSWGFSTVHAQISIPTNSPEIIPTDPDYDVISYNEIRINGTLLLSEINENSLKSRIGNPAKITEIQKEFTMQNIPQRALRYGDCVFLLDRISNTTRFESLRIESQHIWITVSGQTLRVGMLASNVSSVFPKSYANRNRAIENGYDVPLVRIYTYYKNEQGDHVISDSQIVLSLDSAGRITQILVN